MRNQKSSPCQLHLGSDVHVKEGVHPPEVSVVVEINLHAFIHRDEAVVLLLEIRTKSQLHTNVLRECTVGVEIEVHGCVREVPVTYAILPGKALSCKGQPDLRRVFGFCDIPSAFRGLSLSCAYERDQKK